MVETFHSSLDMLPLIKTVAGPMDGDKWIERLKEEYTVLIQYIKMN